MMRTEKHLAYSIRCPLDELHQIVESIDSFYYEKKEVKTHKDGTPKLDAKGEPRIRVMDPSTGRLKQLQKRIVTYILRELPMPDYAYGSVKGKDSVLNAHKHKGKKYKFLTDLKDFFPSITHHQVFKMFCLSGFSPEVARLLTKLTTYKGRIPQGAPTSSYVANLVFVKTGDKLQEFASEHGLTFTSFVDDLTFSAPSNFKGIAPRIIEIIQEDGFKISHKKTNYKTKDPEITGVVSRQNSIDLPMAFRIKHASKEGKSEAQIEGAKQYKKRVLSFNKK